MPENKDKKKSGWKGAGKSAALSASLFLALAAWVGKLSDSEIGRAIRTSPLLGYLIDKPPKPENVSEAADYIERNFEHTHVEDYNDCGGPVFYLYTEAHWTGVHRIHVGTTEELKNAFGLGIVGLEGQREGEVTMDAVRRDFEMLKQLQEIGEYSQLERNQAEVEGREPRRIETLEEFLEVEPVMGFAREGDGISLVGLEDAHTLEQGKLMKILEKTYEMYFNISKELYQSEERLTQLSNKLDKMELKGVTGIDRMRDKLAEIRKNYEKEKVGRTEALAMLMEKMDKTKRGLDPEYALPDYDKNIAANFCTNDYDHKFTPFAIALYKHSQFIKHDKRSIDCVDLLVKQAKSRGENQAAGIFGVGHIDQITGELKARGVSYIKLNLGRRVKADY